MNPRLREARADAQRRRMISLLEALADSAGADVSDMDQCDGCGEFYAGVSSHRPHCSGPER